MMPSIGIAGLGSYLPERKLAASVSDDPMANSPLLRPPEYRHHAATGERAGMMVEQAARRMFGRLGLDPAVSVDVVITNVLLPDDLITGCGAEVAHRLGCKADCILDVHNGGCASFPYMLKLAGRLLDGGDVRRALLCNVQNTAGSVFSQPELAGSSAAAISGDGCGVSYVVCDGPGSVLGVEVRHHTEWASDMTMGTGCGRRYWEAGPGALDVKFSEEKTSEIIARGNSLIPEVVRGVCRQIQVPVSEVDLLITNQPNRIFLRHWRRELEIPSERHFDTFDRCGNLYGAGAPVSLAYAAREGRLRDGDLVVVAGFAHAGDLAAAAAIRWSERTR